MSDRSTGNTMIEMENWVDLQMNGSDTYHHDPMSLYSVCTPAIWYAETIEAWRKQRKEGELTTGQIWVPRWTLVVSREMWRLYK